jgi:hypothetical protein
MPRQQLEIAGTEAPHIEEIEVAAETYVKLRDRRMKLLGEEITAQANLVTVMQAHAKELDSDAEGNKTYTYDDLRVILKQGKVKAKVKTLHADEDEEEED